MRKDSRNVLLQFVLFLLGTTATAAPRDGGNDSTQTSTELVCMTVELNWSAPSGAGTLSKKAPSVDELPADGFFLELSGGRIREALEWSAEGGKKQAVTPTASGAWKLGRRREGRIRARIEAPIEASLVLRGGEQRVSIPLVAVLEHRQQTPPQAALTLAVERLPWDSLAIELGSSGSDGIFTKGELIPISIGYNIIQPETAEVSVRTTAILRAVRSGGEVWRDDVRDILPSNRREPPVRTINLPAPEEEGVYSLEIQATWEPVASKESSRLSRLIRRRKTPAASSAIRRVRLAVLDPKKPAQIAAASGVSGRGQDTDVDSIDLSKARTYRPIASGRSQTAGPGRTAWAVPAEALIEPSRRDRLRGWFSRTGGEASQLDAADSRGLAWSAVGMRVSHPGRPHRITLTIRGGEPAELGVAVVEPSEETRGGANRVLLDASASGPPILQEGPHASFSWFIWPQSPECVLVLLNRNNEAMVRLGTVTLTELDDLPGPPPMSEPAEGSRRTIGFYLTGARALEPFGGDSPARGPLTAAQNLVKYLSFCGATAVVLPESLADRPSRRGLDRQAEEDSTGPDRLDLIRACVARSGYQLWLEVDLTGPRGLNGLPPADSPEAIARGLAQVDRKGGVEGAEYQPLHPDVREAMKRRLIETLPKVNGSESPADRGKTATTAGGLLVRLGAGPTLLGAPDTGLDDVTFGRFVHETFSAESARDIPGQDVTDPERFAVRSRYLSGVGRTPWLTWRSRAVSELYAELTEAVQTKAPGTTLALVTPALLGGPADVEARRVDLSGLAPSQAWRSVGLDLQSWPTGPSTPMILRGTALSTDALAHDLATSPDLDAIVAARPRRGMLLLVDESTPEPPMTALPTAATVSGEAGGEAAAGDSHASGQESETKSGLLGGLHIASRAAAPRAETVWLTALPLGDGPAADEPLGHSLAALDSHCVLLAGKAVAGHEDRVRRFARVLRSLPAWPAAAGESEGIAQTRPFGVTFRTMSDATETYMEIANDSPYPLELTGRLDASKSAQIEDLGQSARLTTVNERDGRALTLDLLPYGVSSIRVSSPGAKLSALTPHPSQAVVSTMLARFNELTVQLARLNHGLTNDAAEPTNAGFEPAGTLAKSAAPIDLPEKKDGEASASATRPNESGPDVLPGGWRIDAKSGLTAEKAEIDLERPRVGQGSLRITAGAKPLSVISEPFTPATQSTLTLQAYFRSAEAGARVRVWIEGQSGGQPYVRRSELALTPEWECRAFRASDVPSGGMDSARVRFEVLTPGIVWIDDLHVTGDNASKSARLNTQRALLAALQAYREARYADFARLSGSHWVRQSGSQATRMARNGGDYRKASRVATGPIDSSAAALSPESKLR